jgi:uncharacterized protein with FMN-binding domain
MIVLNVICASLEANLDTSSVVQKTTITCISKGLTMKKFTVAALIVVAFVIYSLLYNHSNNVALSPNNSSNSSSSSISSNQPSITSTPTGNAGSSGSSVTTNGRYKDGSYTGSAADAFYGYIQVKAIIQNGKIKDVQFLQYPNDRNRSIMINSYADPQLTTEAIQAQSANVNIVTGATDTSDAFIQSLTNALSQAKA